MMIRVDPEWAPDLCSRVKGFIKLLERLEEAPAEGKPLYHVLEISGRTRIDVVTTHEQARMGARDVIADRMDREGFLVAPWKRAPSGEEG